MRQEPQEKTGHAQAMRESRAERGRWEREDFPIIQQFFKGMALVRGSLTQIRRSKPGPADAHVDAEMDDADRKRKERLENPDNYADGEIIESEER